jgi:hypothetical protein
MSIFAMRVERTFNRPHIYAGKMTREARLRRLLFYTLGFSRRQSIEFRGSIKPDLS